MMGVLWMWILMQPRCWRLQPRSLQEKGYAILMALRADGRTTQMSVGQVCASAIRVQWVRSLTLEAGRACASGPRLASPRVEAMWRWGRLT